MRKAATGTGSRKIRPCAMIADNIDPQPTPIANSAVIAVSTPMSPPMRVRTMTGTRASATAPVIQNQLTARPPAHKRRSLPSSRTSTTVEASTLRVTFRSGAAVLR